MNVAIDHDVIDVVDVLPPEERLLLAILSGQSNTGVPERPRDLDLDWERFVKLAWRHRVEPLLGGQVDDWDCPDWVRDHLKTRCRLNSLRALHATETLIDVSRRLADLGSPIVPLKGVVLSLDLYGRIDARHVGDIDFLVAPAMARDADRVMRKAGYVRCSSEDWSPMSSDRAAEVLANQNLNYLSPSGMQVEMHVKLHRNPAMMPVGDARDVVPSRQILIGGQSFATFSRDDLFCYLVTHGARHAWKRLQWLCDVAKLISVGKEDELGRWLKRAEALGVTNSAAQALSLASALLRCGGFDEEMSGAGRKRSVRYLVRRAGRTMFRSLDDQLDDPGGFNPAVRLYHHLLCNQPNYRWQELTRAVSSLFMRA